MLSNALWSDTEHQNWHSLLDGPLNAKFLSLKFRSALVYRKRDFDAPSRKFNDTRKHCLLKPVAYSDLY